MFGSFLWGKSGKQAEKHIPKMRRTWKALDKRQASVYIEYIQYFR